MHWYRFIIFNCAVKLSQTYNYLSTYYMNLSKRDCENAEIFWWKLYNRYSMYKRLRQECLNPEKYIPKNVINTPFIQKFLGTCKLKLSGGDALLRIEQLKDAADKALPNVLEKCNCKKNNYRITNRLKNRLIELSGLYFLKSNELISKKDFIALYKKYTKKYSNKALSHKRYSRKDLRNTSSKMLNTILKKNIEKSLSNAIQPSNVKTLPKRASLRNTRKTSARNTRKTSARNTRKTSARNTRKTRRTSGRGRTKK